MWPMSDLTPRPGHLRTPLVVALVVLNALLSVSVLFTWRTDGPDAPTTTAAVSSANGLSPTGSAEIGLLRQVSPFFDAVHTLDILVSDARLDENSAAWLHAHVLSAGRTALSDGGRVSAAGAMAGVIEGLISSTLSRDEAAALRQRHRAVGDSVGDRVATEQLLLADLNTYERYLGASPDEQQQVWATLTRLTKGPASASIDDRCETPATTSPGEMAADYARLPFYQSVDVLHLKAPEGTPRLSGMWLQVTVDALRGRSDEAVADLLTDVAVAWYDHTLELSADNSFVSYPAAAAGSWYGVVEGRLDGPITLLPWSDLLLETAVEMRFADTGGLAGWAAQVDKRLDRVDDMTIEVGFTRGYCAARTGRS